MKEKFHRFANKNRYLIIALFIIMMAILFYCTMNTAINCDDWPYSLYLRGSERISSFKQILINQKSDYMYIVGRPLLNGLGQIILMFPRIFFAISNSFIIIIILAIICKIIKLANDKVHGQIIGYFVLLIFGLFLSIDNLKYIVYWVMGSSNYLWPAPLLLWFIYRYLKYKHFEHNVMNYLIITVLASAHEALFVFFVIFLIGNIIIELIENKRFDFRYLIYMIIIIGSGAFILLSPGNIIRNSTWYPWWNEMSWFSRLSMTVPQVSLTMFQFDIVQNLIPFIYLLSIIYLLFKQKHNSKVNWYMIALLSLFYFGGIISGNGWLYFIYSALLFLIVAWIYLKNRENHWTIILLSFYAIVYAMIITPEYAAGRPNILMYLFMILMIAINFSDFIIRNKIFKTAILVFFLIYSTKEIYQFTKIGEINKIRTQALQEVQKGNTKTLQWKRMPSEIAHYIVEPNAPAEKNYWAWTYFCNYNNISIDTKIELYE